MIAGIYLLLLLFIFGIKVGELYCLLGIENGAAVFDMRIYLLSLPLGIIPYYKKIHICNMHITSMAK